MPNGDGWKETFKFFIKELEEVYLPQLKERIPRDLAQLKEFWDLVLPVPPLGGEPEKGVEEVPQSVPAPPPTAPYTPPIPYEPPMFFAAGEPPIPYDPPEELPGRTPFPPWDPQHLWPYGYQWETPAPLAIDPGPPTPWWQGPEGIPGEPDVPWWREIPPAWFEYDTHTVQALRDRERKT